MERLLERLPRKPYSALTRYALSTLFVLGALLVMMLVRISSPLQGYFLLYPAIFMATVIFNKGSGYYATALAVVAALAIGAWQESFGFFIEAGWSLLLFGLVGLGIAWITESMRRSWERAKRAEEAKGCPPARTSAPHQERLRGCRLAAPIAGSITAGQEISRGAYERSGSASSAE